MSILTIAWVSLGLLLMNDHVATSFAKHPVATSTKQYPFDDMNASHSNLCLIKIQAPKQ
jgi:hypothetical protein